MAGQAPLIEVFSSVQGEGRHVGRAMVFVRVGACPIRCLYCDTPHSYRPADTFVVASADGSREVANPITGAAAAVLALESAAAHPYGPSRWVSLTGGEPLLYPGFIREFGLPLRAAGQGVLLETAALDPERLESCVVAIDHLSADYKLPGTLVEPRPEAGAQARRCAEIALAAGKSVDLKMVLTPAIREVDYVAALAALEPLAGRIELVLQPVTPTLHVAAACEPEQLARFAALAAGFDPMVLPQVHKQLGIE